MNQETELTGKQSLNEMYEQGIDHAIEILKDETRDDYFYTEQIVNTILWRIIGKLQNLKSKTNASTSHSTTQPDA